MKPIYMFSGLLGAALLLTVFINLDGVYADGPKHGHHHYRIMEQLNDEQKDEVKSMIADLKEDGATREDIRDAVNEKLAEYGIELSKNGERSGNRGFMGRGFPIFCDDLTEEQQTTLKEKIESMRKGGADRKEIHEEIRKMLNSYGIEVPEDAFKRSHRSKRHSRLFMDANLTDEQKKAVKEKVESMREHDASREEIHDTVTKMLKDFGVEIPEDVQKHCEIMKNLSEKQRNEVREAISTMRKEGASKEDVHDAVNQLLKGYGIDPPDSDVKQDNSKQSMEGNLEIQNFPNPFNPETNIQYTLQSDVEVKIQIFDVQGKLVRSLLNEHQSAGTHTSRWDGLSENRNQVPSGVYFLRLSAGSETVSKRIVMTK